MDGTVWGWAGRQQLHVGSVATVLSGREFLQTTTGIEASNSWQKSSQCWWGLGCHSLLITAGRAQTLSLRGTRGGDELWMDAEPLDRAQHTRVFRSAGLC